MDRLATILISGEAPDHANSIVWQQSREEVDLVPLDAFCESLLKDLDAAVASEKGIDKDMFEGVQAGYFHRAAQHLPMQVLDDPGFWRYLSLNLWEMVSWREKLSEKNIRTYMDGTSSSECVPLRMFLRAQAVQIGASYELAGAISTGTDFWRSHVIRVRVGAYPPVARAFATMQRDDRLSTNPLRSFARRLNRIGSNVVLALYDDEESTALLAELLVAERAQQQSGGGAGDE